MFIDFFSSPEDRNLKFQFADLLKGIRLFALFLSLLLPGLYVAITTYHQELIPTEFLFAIIASRNNVPFPVIFEILIMEISLELIREAGVRVPSPLGQTISIVRSLNFRRSCCFCKLSKSNFSYCYCYYWYNFVCCSGLFIKFPFASCKIYLHCTWLSCWIFRNCFWTCYTFSNTC